MNSPLIRCLQETRPEAPALRSYRHLVSTDLPNRARTSSWRPLCLALMLIFSVLSFLWCGCVARFAVSSLWQARQRAVSAYLKIMVMQELRHRVTSLHFLIRLNRPSFPLFLFFFALFFLWNRVYASPVSGMETSAANDSLRWAHCGVSRWWGGRHMPFFLKVIIPVSYFFTTPLPGRFLWRRFKYLVVVAAKFMLHIPSIAAS